MSVATEFPPEVYIPVSARPSTGTVLQFRPRRVPYPVVDGDSLRQVARRAARAYAVRSVAVIGEPTRSSAPLRLTRRGHLAAVGLAAAFLAGTLWLAHESVPPSGPAPAGQVAAVTVRAGDTLWSIASRIAPQRDPRVIVAALQRVNHLSDLVVHPGQVLRTAVTVG